MTCSDEKPEEEAKQIDILLSRQAEGLLVSTCQCDDRYGVFERAKELRVPVVMIARNIDPPMNSWVGSDNVNMARTVTSHLVSAGRKRIAHLRGPTNSTASSRIEGYREALREAGLPQREEYLRGGGETDAIAERGMSELLELSEPPDAVFCYNDAVAAACMRVIMNRGLRVPDDIALAGIGNTRFSDVLWSPLTTVNQSPDQIGEIAATNLLRAIDTNAETGNVTVPGDLIVRQSCGVRCSLTTSR
jgi:LacI family transcriptional regulator